MILESIQSCCSLLHCGAHDSVGSQYLLNFSGYPVRVGPKSVPSRWSQLTSCTEKYGSRRVEAKGRETCAGASEGLSSLMFQLVCPYNLFIFPPSVKFISFSSHFHLPLSHVPIVSVHELIPPFMFIV